MMAFIQQYFSTVATALFIMGTAYFLTWKLLRSTLRNRKIQLSERAGWPQIKEEIIATMLSFIGSTAFMLGILYFKDHGLTKFYVETGRYGMWYEVLAVATMIALSDTWFYWCHRAMHHESVYKYVHALHHKSLDVNPFTSTSFHVVEAVLLTVWVLPLALVMPISMTALGVMQVLGTLNNLKSHLGFELFPKFFTAAPFNVLVTATNHSLHHTQYNGNYGLFFRFWDVVCGTELPTTTGSFEEIHHRHNANIIDNTRYRTLTIDRLVKENRNTVSVYFTPQDRAFYDYKAGHYLTLRVNVNGTTHSRCFSLSSTPELDNFLRITVKLKGEVSHYFYHAAKAGDAVESLLPVGEFTFAPNAASAKKYVLIAGGSGITPLFSMLQQILHNEPQSSVALLYANTSRENIIFARELSELAEQFPQFSYTDYISGQRRITKEDLRGYGDASYDVSYYICGPNSLKQAMLQHLKELHIAKTNIHTENFADGYVPWFGLTQRKKSPSFTMEPVHSA
jgi:ring-1,2-phenylacetyl-CoA epoxidase subunit PaaE